MAPERILVVDDDEALRETLSEVLSDEGYEVVAVADGEAALEHVGDRPTDLIILDVMLPRMDAYSFRAAQLEAEHQHLPPVIVLSAVPDLATAATRLNAAAWIAKPFRLDDLLARIRETLDLERAAAR